jgi:hypothetical protein
VAQQEFDPYELLDALRVGGDVDLIRADRPGAETDDARVPLGLAQPTFLHQPDVRCSVNGYKISAWNPK